MTPTARSLRHRDTAGYRRMRKQVFRDRGDFCGICGDVIDHETYSWPHPYSRTLHHPHPIKYGGALEDPANAVAAHKRCNESVGAGRQTPRTHGDRSARW